MSIFLLVLKIIGIVLLSVVGLVVLILSLILFVPIRYRIGGKYENDPEVVAKVSWLLHILSVKASFIAGKLTYTIRLFGIPLKGSNKKEKPRKVKKTKDKKDKKGQQKPVDRLPREDEYRLEGFEKQEITVTESPEDEEVKEEQEQGFISKCKEFLTKIFDTILHFKEKVKDAYENFVIRKDKILHYLDLIGDPKNQETFKRAVGEVFKILKAVKPRKWHVAATYGSEEPDTVGKVLVVLSILYPFIGGHVDFEPVFDEAVIKADGYAKGRIFVIVVLIALWKLYFNKELRKVIKEFKEA